ncbi:MAG: DUF4129 domain-containing protein [Myxococcota bacterium]
MDLERVTVVLRPRGAWESLDLGFQLVRRYAPSIYAAWVAVYLPVCLAVYTILDDQVVIAFAVCWWLRPLFERAVLAVLGPAVFGAAPSPREIARGWLSFVARVIAPSPASGLQLLAALTWRRLSPWRSYVLPVDQLEMLGFGDRRARVAVLGRNHRDTAVGLSLLSLMLEASLYFALAVFLTLLVPEGVDHNPMLWLMEGETFAARTTRAVLLALAYSVAGPLYVGAGFALYLNRRMELEAWDLELSFRRIAQRRAMVTSVLLGALVLPMSADATEPVDPQDAVRKVLSGPEFSDYEEDYEWQFKREDADADNSEAYTESNAPSLLENIGKAFAKLLFWLGVAVAIVVVAVVLRALWRIRESSREIHRGAASAPATLFGLDVRRESLPDDIVGAARVAWANDPRLALSLLYRGALGYLIHRRGFRISEAATEGECAALVRRKQSDLSEDFDLLTQTWTRLAYGERVPAAERFHALADRWANILGAE